MGIEKGERVKKKRIKRKGEGVEGQETRCARRRLGDRKDRGRERKREGRKRSDWSREREKGQATSIFSLLANFFRQCMFAAMSQEERQQNKMYARYGNIKQSFS